MSAIEGTWRAASRDQAGQRWPIAQGLIASIFFALGLASFLLVRRATGALAVPLPLLPLTATAMAIFTWVWGVRIAWARQADRGAIVASPFDRIVVIWLPLVTLMAVAVACSYPGQRVVDWLVWLPVIVANSVGPQRVARWWRAHASTTFRASPTSCNPTAAGLEQPSEASEDSETLLQQLNRFRDADGRETVRGTLVAEFAPGERTATLHIAFCPPFELLPQVQAEIADGPDANVKVAQVLHNGARLDVRLVQPTIVAAAVSLEIVAGE
jgi:hypothetical protein